MSLWISYKQNLLLTLVHQNGLLSMTLKNAKLFLNGAIFHLILTKSLNYTMMAAITMVGLRSY